MNPWEDSDALVTSSLNSVFTVSNNAACFVTNISGKNTLVVYGKFLLVQERYYKLRRRATWLLNKSSVKFEAKIHSVQLQCFIFIVLDLRNFQMS